MIHNSAQHKSNKQHSVYKNNNSNNNNWNTKMHSEREGEGDRFWRKLWNDFGFNLFVINAIEMEIAVNICNI